MSAQPGKSPTENFSVLKAEGVIRRPLVLRINQENQVEGPREFHGGVGENLTVKFVGHRKGDIEGSNKEG